MTRSAIDRANRLVTLLDCCSVAAVRLLDCGNEISCTRRILDCGRRLVTDLVGAGRVLASPAAVWVTLTVLLFASVARAAPLPFQP